MSLDFLPATPWSLPLILFHTSERESNVQSEFSSPAGIQSSQHNFWALRGAAPSSEDVTLQSGGVALIKPSRSYLRLKAARTHSFYCSSFGWTAQHMLTLIPAHGGSETSHQPPGQSHMYRESQSSRPIHHADSPDGGGRAAEVRGQRSRKHDLSESSCLSEEQNSSRIYAAKWFKVSTFLQPAEWDVCVIWTFLQWVSYKEHNTRIWCDLDTTHLVRMSTSDVLTAHIKSWRLKQLRLRRFCPIHFFLTILMVYFLYH